MLNVIFLWHMHQPYYVNPLTKTAEMPWVRLHAVKGYLDMISVLEDFPNVRVNFNMTPVLVKQILEFNEGSVKDLWFEASLKPAADLSAQDKNLILENFFKINWDNMLKPHLRFAELLYKRGQSFSPGQSSSVADRFNEQDFRDVQTWFNLGWCGYRAEHYFPRLRELKIKGSGFSESEKLEVLDIHRQILRLVLKKYGEMEQAGRVELTTTPFYHPILPLVYDSELARRCMPGRKLPRPFSYPEDALSHLVRAADQHEQVFGRRPRGLWPSEGSVAPELIPLMRKAGFEYFCTDEANLFNSLNHDPAWAGKTADHLELFQGWSAQYEGAKINAVFRERPLSDFIGFVASKNSPQQAADHLIFNLEHIATVAHEPNAMIALILDGENAWEHFADGGEGFLRNLYGRLSDHPVLRTKCISDYFAEFPQTKTTTTLHTGSWINSDFDIWIGDEAEENVAWDMLGQTRKFLEEQVRGGRLSDEAKNRAFEEIYAAEGSDWFWWYGPDFQTDCDMLFDSLFRTHLQNVYRIAGSEPPHSLYIPVRRPRVQQATTTLKKMTPPTIDGEITSLAEWYGAGLFIAGRDQGAMFRSDRLINAIRYGYDNHAFYLAADFAQFQPCNLRIDFIRPTPFRLTFEIDHKEDLMTCAELSFDGVHFMKVDLQSQARHKNIFEVAIPLHQLPWKFNDEIHFMVLAYRDNVEIERHPVMETISFHYLDN